MRPGGAGAKDGEEVEWERTARQGPGMGQSLGWAGAWDGAITWKGQGHGSREGIGVWDGARAYSRKREEPGMGH